MTITAVTQSDVHFVITDEEGWHEYTRYSPDSWTVRMGESDESVYDCARLEAAFQTFIANKKDVRTSKQMQAERDEARSVAKHLREMLLDLTKRYAGPSAPPPPAFAMVAVEKVITMKATILDTVTGEKMTVDGPCSWQWAENNWSCDCNRNPWGVDTGKPENVCEGCERFLVVEAVMNNPEDYEYTLDELNEGYPAELRARFLGQNVELSDRHE